jgi:hypothetical protein
MQKKILIVLPDGVGLRNYMYSDLMRDLAQTATLVVGTPLEAKAFDAVKTHLGIDFEIVPIRLRTENALGRLCRESATFARLLHNAHLQQNDTIRSGNWNFNPKGWKLQLLGKITQAIGFWASKKYTRILRLETKVQQQWSGAVANCQSELMEIQPDVVFIAHQRVASLMPYTLAAQKLGIPVQTVIYSWDNLPKARLNVRADVYLVWSEHMKQEMATYYPEIPADKVKVTGTPQFEFYRDTSNIIPRDDFYYRFGLDPNKKIICYSGDDTLTCPDDSAYLRDLANALIKFGYDATHQILLRRCPVDFSDRYNEVLKEFSSLVKVADPLWIKTRKEDWGGLYPTYEDVKLLVSTAYYSEVVVNLGSTMAFDFSMFDKPCVYLNYDQEVKVNPNWSVKTIYQFQHFRSMPNKDAVIWLNSPNEIIEKVLVRSNYDPKKMGQWRDLVIGNPYNVSSAIKEQLILS